MSERHHAVPLINLARFFSIGGRIGTIRFVIVVGIFVSICLMITWGFATFGTATFPLLGAVGGAVIAKLFAEAGRRCHDVNRSATIGALVLVGTFLALSSVLLMLIVGTMAIAVGTVVTLTFAATFLRPGQTATNSYGAPPLGVLRSGRPDHVQTGDRSLVWAMISILGCAAIGLTIQTSIDRSRSDRERRDLALTRQSTATPILGKIAA